MLVDSPWLSREFFDGYLNLPFINKSVTKGFFYVSGVTINQS